jgi:hypothetical protein
MTYYVSGIFNAYLKFEPVKSLYSNLIASRPFFHVLVNYYTV